MKIILLLTLCSYAAGGACLPPFQWPDAFDSNYDCSIFGYEESARKLKEIGREEVELHKLSITFTCTIPEGSNT